MLPWGNTVPLWIHNDTMTNTDPLCWNSAAESKPRRRKVGEPLNRNPQAMIESWAIQGSEMAWQSWIHGYVALVPQGLQGLWCPKERCIQLAEIQSWSWKLPLWQEESLEEEGRPSQSVEGGLAKKKCRSPAPSVPSTPVRQDNTDHWPVWV